MGLWPTYPWRPGLSVLCHNLVLCPDNLVAFNIVDFRLLTNPVEDCVCESSSIAFDMTVVDVTDSTLIIHKKVLGVCRLEEVIMIAHNRLRRVLLQYDDI